MHELSLCRAVYDTVEAAAAGRTIEVVHLRIGQLRQVVPQTLAYCWDLVVENTPLAGSVLEIDHVPVVLDCRACGRTTTVEHTLVLTCAGCGSGDIALRTGEEMLVTSIDVVAGGSAAAGPPVVTSPPTAAPAES